MLTLRHKETTMTKTTPKRLTKDDVIRAIEELVAKNKGTIPTQREVREHLGYGSYETIQRWLREWRDEHTAKRTKEIPPIPERLLNAVSEAWVDVIRFWGEKVHAERQALADKSEAMEREILEITREMDRIVKKNEDLQSQNENFQGQLKKAHAEVEDIRIRNARLDERAAGLSREIEGYKAQLAEAIRTAQTERK